MPSASRAATAEAGTRLELRDALGLLACSSALVGLVYHACLDGPFLSDDPGYYLSNPYTRALTLENLVAILDPGGTARFYAFNYAPVHLLLVALESQLFGPHMPGYHGVNLLLHALNAVLLVALLLSSGLPRATAFLGGALFAAHPANVEAVAWISQLKSVAALALGLGAVLALWRRPLVATALFALALLTKFSAVAFLPLAAALAWSRRSGRRTWAWLGSWLGVLALVSLAQLAAFGAGGVYEVPVYDDRWQQLRSVVGIGARYLWMAASGSGLSTHHEPAPSPSALDPWWLAGLALAVPLAWRSWTALRRRQEEGAYWILAAAAFVPVSQLVPFRFPMADRYLYFILPGLIGGVLLAASALARRRLALWAGAGLVALFAWQSAARVPIWTDGRHLLIDAATHYPAGSHGHYLRAVEAAGRGDAETAVALLRAVEKEKRLSLVKDFGQDPLLAPIRSTPVFREFLREVARFRIELVGRRGLRPGEHVTVALQHATLGEYDEAIALLEEALRRDHPRRAELLAVIEDLRRHTRQPRDAPR